MLIKITCGNSQQNYNYGKEKEGPGLWFLGCFDPSGTLWSFHGGQVLSMSKSTSFGDYVNPKSNMESNRSDYLLKVDSHVR